MLYSVVYVIVSYRIEIVDTG